jgi:hypothetical protein
MVGGWGQFRDLYLLQGFTRVRVLYYGSDLFQVEFGNRVDDTLHIPSFHNRSTVEGETKYFDFILEGFGGCLDTYLVWNFYIVFFIYVCMKVCVSLSIFL